MKVLFRSTICTLAWLFLTTTLQGQDMSAFNTFNTERDRITANSMLVLGGWAAGNVIAGGVGMANTDKGTEAFHFHQ